MSDDSSFDSDSSNVSGESVSTDSADAESEVVAIPQEGPSDSDGNDGATSGESDSSDSTDSSGDSSSDDSSGDSSSDDSSGDDPVVVSQSSQRSRDPERERQRQILRRSQETPEQAARRRDSNRERMRALREERSEEDTLSFDWSSFQGSIRTQIEELTSEDRELLQEEAAALKLAAERAKSFDNMGSNYNPFVSYSEFKLLDIGEMSRLCRSCGALCFKAEKPGLCCSKGAISIPPLRPPDCPAIAQLFSGEGPLSKHFLEHIRRYNSCFQMTSFGVTGGVAQDSMWSTFACQGQIYHRIGALLPPPGDQASFLQIYFLGEEEQYERRLSIARGFTSGHLKENLIKTWQDFLNSRNCLIKEIMTAMERNPDEYRDLTLRGDIRVANIHPRNINLPSSNEVAIVIVGDETSGPRDIILRKRNNALMQVKWSNPFYDAFQYPLIFWSGRSTYHFDYQRAIRTAGRKNNEVSCADYYAYIFMTRTSASSNDSMIEKDFVLTCGTLFNQYVVDMYAKVEAQRLDFIRRNQQHLRSDQYIHLCDALAGEGNLSEVGQTVILPSSYSGSPRHMHEYAQDAMAYVRKFGRPDFFITFTCNPKWTEIVKNCRGRPPTLRPDIVSRVFAQKVKKFKEALTKFKLFGKSCAYMYSIEWQKRGLPHCHLLLWLGDKLTPDRIDNFVSAEIPDPSLDPVLYSAVTSHMIHGPCGDDRGGVCMERGKCSKNFPKPFRRHTMSAEDGYPSYRRRSPAQGGRCFVMNRPGKPDVVVDNSYVVPYSPVLLKMFNAHINVEYCNSVKSIKYICKYINKGSDHALFNVQRTRARNADGDQRQVLPRNEVQDYLLGTYHNSSKALWHIFKEEIHSRDPPVQRLHVHLENGQRVLFDPDRPELIPETCPPTTLTEFFKLCREDDFARTLLYSEVPTYYTWDSNAARKAWSKRKQGRFIANYDGFSSNMIGRIYNVHPKDKECFHLRILLTKVRGPRGHNELKTVDGVMCGSFTEACRLRGFLESDSHWRETLQELCDGAITTSSLRSLFAIILTSGEPSDPEELWDEFKDRLSDDILLRARRENPNIDIQRDSFRSSIYNQALILLEDICLRIAGVDLKYLRMPSPDRDSYDPANAEILRETSYDVVELANYVSAHNDSLKPDQRTAYEAVIEAVNRGQGGLFFIDAPGGTGKTFLLNYILADIRSSGDASRPGIAVAVATSGLAATLLSGGRTAHSTFKIPLNLTRTELPMCSLTAHSSKAKMLQQCKAIIWDECTMMNKKGFEAVDRLLRDITKKTDKEFGGIVMVLAGDFRQTLPVVRRGTPADEMSASLKQSSLWNKFRKFKLTLNMRVHLHNDVGAQDFCNTLLEIGDGKYPIDARSNQLILANRFCIPVESSEELIKRVFSNLSQRLRVNSLDEDWIRDRAILAPTNDAVDKINEVVQKENTNFPEKLYRSFDSTEMDDDATRFPIEFLNSVNPAGFPTHELKLKVGSPIILLRNLDPPTLCNGTRLMIVDLRERSIIAKILVGPFKGKRCAIPRIPLITDDDLVFKFRRRQFPVKLAYAMTINKSQGQTIKTVGVDLSTPCFSHGQFYVACSRVSSPSSIYIYAPENKTRNVVYPYALSG